MTALVPDAPGVARRPTGAVLGAVLVAAVVWAVAVHGWELHAPVAALDSDGAVPGLMAKHLRHGEMPVFYWGQAYGGSFEAAIAGLVFLVTGPSVLVLKLVPMLLGALAALLVWAVGRRTVGEPAARVGGVLTVVWPAAFLWWSAKIGTYQASLVLALAALTVLLVLVDRPEWPAAWAGGLGVLCGLAWWANIQTVYILLPAVVWFAAPIVRHWRRLWLVALGFVIGAGPWIGFNVRNHWISLKPPAAGPGNTYQHRVWTFFTTVLPEALGLRVPFTRAWVGGGTPGRVAYVVVLVAFVAAVIVVVVRRPRWGVLVLTAALYPFLYGLSPLSFYLDQPRYVLMLSPTLALLGAASAVWAGHRLRPSSATVAGLVPAAVVVVAAIVSAMALGQMNRSRSTSPYGPDVLVPASFADLDAVLRDEHVTGAFADYWIAYRAMFETDERVAVSPYFGGRRPAIDDSVRRSDHPAFIFLRGSKTLDRFRQLAAERGVALREATRGAFVLEVPDRRLFPEDLPNGWSGP